MTVKRTPAMEQYLEQKERYKDALLLFRMGDFYEIFFEDAIIASRELEIALTSRDRNKENGVPMCGVPHHAVESYIQRLLERGYKVAISEQIEDPSQAQGVVKRAVTRVITPGVALNADMIDGKESLYVAAVAEKKNRYGVAYAEFTTGEFAAFEVSDLQSLSDEIERLHPAETILSEEISDALSPDLPGARTVKSAHEFELDKAVTVIFDHFGASSLDGLGLTDHEAATAAVGALIKYLKDAQGDSEKIDDEAAWMAGSARYLGNRLEHLREFRFQTLADTMIIDGPACANLELIETLRDRKRSGSLLAVIDKSVTAAGGRLIKKWLLYPLIDPITIKSRQKAVSVFVEDGILRNAVRAALDKVHDLERLSGKISGGNVNPRDLLALAATLDQIPAIETILADSDEPEISRIRGRLNPIPELVEIIGKAIREDSPANLRDGGVFKRGYNAERDELESLAKNSREIIAGIEARERNRSGINNLKIGYNKVFGYYIEITRSYLDAVPVDYIRKQTLVNAERFVTPELKELEEKILNAEENIVTIEYRLFKELREIASRYIAAIQSNAAALAELDVYQSLAEVAARNRYCRPEVDDSGIIEIEAGRHPVVETMGLGERFVPNDVKLDPNENQVLIITGPNMAGKSTVMRQVALIVLLAQMGSFVPADKARVGVVDRIFTRVGAGDILHRGQSTFMVEMSETAHIMRHATPKSLVLLDEIGRGTSTFDGLSIAWAVAEYLHDNVGAKTLFATHYHELTDLALTKPRVSNVHIAVKEWGGKIIFLRKIMKGGVNRSYGIQVARLAGLPASIIERSKEILANLETGEMEFGAPRLARPSKRTGNQMPLFELATPSNKSAEDVFNVLREIDANNITPLEALALLTELQQKIKTPKE